MNREIFKVLYIIFFIIIVVFLGFRLNNELKQNQYTVCEAIAPNTYKILNSDMIIVSFNKYLKMKKINNVAAIYISPVLINNNEEKIFKILKQSKLKIVLLERMRLPDYGELPVYFSKLPLIRGHKIPQDEWNKMKEREILLRFRRAIVERNVSVIFLPKNSAYLLSKLKHLVKPYQFTSNLVLKTYNYMPFLLRLLFLFVIFFIVIFVADLFHMENISLLFIGTLVIYLFFSWIGLENRIKNIYILVLITLIFYKYFELFFDKEFLNFFYITGINLLIGISIYILFMSKAYNYYILRFRGIKIFFLLPLLINFIQTLIFLAVKRIQIKRYIGLFSFFFIILLFFIIIRSGNGKIIYAQFEGKIREFFEIHLFARPRFKEIFGHALLFYGLYKYKKDVLFILLILMGMIGQLSMINTFLHFTHPIYISILQSIYGIIIGIILGTLIIMVDKLIIKRTE